MKKVTTFKEAEEYLNQFIPKNFSQKFPGDWGLKRTKHLMQLLDNPQNKLKVIHIAGTSGKGSTAYLMSKVLKGQGFKVGLAVSPYIIDIRERFHIDNELISEKEFCDSINYLQPFIKKIIGSPFGSPTYFEITVALSYLIFFHKKVDYAVMETGMGGLLDGTNVVDRPDKVCIITRIGHDHMNILGKTLSKIAAQKAGIIKNKNTVITFYQKKSIRNEIEKAVESNSAHVIYVNKKDIKKLKQQEDGVSFNFTFSNIKYHNLFLNLFGHFQTENCSLALTTLLVLSHRDKFQVIEKTLRDSLSHLSFPGRMEQFIIDQKRVMVDGAHNPQKMRSFIISLKRKFPHQNFNFLIAVKKGKDYKKMLRYMTPVANSIIITTFFSDKQDLIQFSEKPEIIAQSLDSLMFSNYEIIKSSGDALKHFLKKDNLVITGSFYLIGELYPLLRKHSESGKNFLQ